MSISMYDATTPLLVRGLKNLSALLDKGLTESGLTEADLLDSRLSPDMLPLLKQIQIASDTSKGAVARLAQVDNPAMADDETTLAQLKDRIAKTIAFIESVDPAKFEGAADRPISLKFPQIGMEFSGIEYWRQFVLPNFYFHLAIAYGILRSKGATLGKGDFLGVDHSVLRFNT